MKYLILAAVAFSIPVVLGLPVAGLHNDGALTPRFVVRHDDILSARGLSLSNLNPFKSKPLTEQEKQEKNHHKISKGKFKLQKTQQKRQVKINQVDAGGANKYKLQSDWKASAPGHAEHGAIAHDQAQKYWNNNVDVHQFSHAEISAKVHTDGRIWTTARYHNGGAVGGATVHMFSDAPKGKKHP